MNRLPYGYWQVIKYKKWKEITVGFNFPPTTTNTSFVLSTLPCFIIMRKFTSLGPRVNWFNCHKVGGILFMFLTFFCCEMHLTKVFWLFLLSSPSPVSNSLILNEPANPILYEVQPHIKRIRRRASIPISGGCQLLPILFLNSFFMLTIRINWIFYVTSHIYLINSCVAWISDYC